MRKPCSDAGHCWHLEDGELYQRHSGNPPSEVVDVTCCWCGEDTSLPGYSAHTLKSTITVKVEHGPHSAIPDDE